MKELLNKKLFCVLFFLTSLNFFSQTIIFDYKNFLDGGQNINGGGNVTVTLQNSILTINFNAGFANAQFISGRPTVYLGDAFGGDFNIDNFNKLLSPIKSDNNIHHNSYQVKVVNGWLIINNILGSSAYYKSFNNQTITAPFILNNPTNIVDEPISTKEFWNTVETYNYNIKEEFTSASKVYFDNLGKKVQSQTYDRKENRMWMNQTLYDEQGRPAFNTLSAPISNRNTIGEFKFKSDFIKKTNGNTNFTSFDFTNNIYNPEKIGSTPFSLGWYYSASNTNEPYQDVTDRPYSRTIYSTLNPGAVKQTIGGNKIENVDTNKDGIIDSKDGWPQGYSFSMPAAQEMYYVFGHDYFETSPDIKTTYNSIPEFLLTDSDKQINWLKATKTVVEDVNGTQSVVFTDTDGKTLAAARVGIPETYGKTEKKFQVLSLIGPQKYVDIHIPEGCSSAFVGGTSSDFKIYNLKTEEIVNTLGSGFYRVEYIGTTALTKEHQLTYSLIDSQTSNPVKPDAVGIRYDVNYYDFSLNYYNKTGQLTSSLQPVGFNDTCLEKFVGANSVAHDTNAITTFTYNVLGQLITTTSPDEGTANFKYRKDGQIRFSQNSKQLNADEFSYTNYDEFGRPIESGVAKFDNLVFSSLDPDSSTYLHTGKKSFREQHFTEYDFLSNELALQNLFGNDVNGNPIDDYDNPTFLSGNVATTYNKDGNTIISQTWYSYDLYGRVKWIVQKIDGLNQAKTIDYVYDPVTSQVKSVIYQKHEPTEYFEHHYTYNIAQELEKVQTRTSASANFITHADYNYYETGALKRTTLASGIQDIDYVYNLAGQLKAINHPSLATDPNLNPSGNDLFGMSLDYYNGDYKRNTNGINFSMLTNGTNQYNGNIKGMTWNTSADGTINNPFQYSYQYNKNNWLTEANFNANGNLQPLTTDLLLQAAINTTANAEATNSITLKPGFSFVAATGKTFTAVIDANPANNANFETTDYRVSGITYDANGNIKTLNRNKNTDAIGNSMDILTYNYKETTKPNQLDHIIDGAGNIGVGDIGTQNPNNYEYNNIGQLTKNINENVEYTYNASGLVTTVSYNGFVKVAFFYNDKGFRTKKITYTSESTNIEKTTHYVLDAAGSTLAIYENEQQVEIPIYGASRLGIYKRPSNTSLYQLTDHLGNVRAVIASDGAGGAIAKVATDYYPFGMPMPGRKIRNGESYRYAYQGQELDPETGKEAFQLRLWDSRIGRWLTTDPAGQHASPYLGMSNNPISRIDPDGGFDWYANGDGELEWHHGSDNIEGLMWVASDGTSSADLSRIGKWLGGSGNISGAGLVFSHIASIGNGWDDGLEQRGKDFVSFMDDPKGRTLQGIANSIDGAGSFILDYTLNGNGMDIWGFAGKRAFEGMSEMSLYDWGYAAGYNGPDFAVGALSGYALSALRLGSIRVPVYRTFGGGISGATGESWSLINPRLYGSHYRNFAGLPDWNTSAFQVRGTVELQHIIKIRPALPYHGNFGRFVPEAVINPTNVHLTHYNGFRINH